LFFNVAFTAEWSHKESEGLGPSKWSTEFPACGGVRQSPININWWETQYVFGSSLVTLVGALKRPISMKYKNDGHGFFLTFEYADGVPPGITGGPLGQNVYKFHSLHIHWKSEHTVNNNYYDAELHLVHFNAKYQTLADAVGQTDGLAVLGIFYTVSQH
jgi:carbonic anhydrase